MSPVCLIKFDCTALMYREIKALYRYGDNLYCVYFSVCTNEWIFGNGKRIQADELEKYIDRNFSMNYIEDCFKWFAELADRYK